MRSISSSVDGLKRPTPPSRQYPPTSEEVELMDGDEGPFLCANCVYYEGSGEPCIWQTKALAFDKCCRRFWPVPAGKRLQFEDLIKLRDE